MTRAVRLLAIAPVLAAFAATTSCVAGPGGGDGGADAPSRLATIVVVRHAEAAEDGGPDPGLTEAGHARAARLARLLAESDLAAVWTSELRRARETGRPSAAAAGLEPRTRPAADVDGLARQLRDAAVGAVLVVGHSNTVPDLLRALGADDPPPIAHDEFDHLFVLPLADGRPGRLVVLRLDAAGSGPAP